LDADTLSDRAKVLAITRAENASNASFGDMEYEFWRNSILSGATTGAANIIGNNGNFVTEYALIRPAEATINALTGNKIKEGTTFGDLMGLYKGMIPGFKIGYKNALQAFMDEVPTVSGMKLDDTGVAIPGTAGRIIRTPQRLLLAMDEWAKGMIMHMEVGVQANMIGRGKNMTGSQLANFVRSQIENSDSQSWSNALEKAKELTFQTKPGAIANAIIKGRRTPGIGGFVARHVVPFVTTPTNILKTGLRRTPLGAIDAIAKKAKGELPSGQVLRRSSEQLLAWGTAMWLYGMVNSDSDEPPKITGSAAALNERGKRDLQYRTYPPQSIRIGDQWFSYARIEPVATSLSTMIDAMTKNNERFRPEKLENNDWLSEG